MGELDIRGEVDGLIKEAVFECFDEAYNPLNGTLEADSVSEEGIEFSIEVSEKLRPDILSLIRKVCEMVIGENVPCERGMTDAFVDLANDIRNDQRQTLDKLLGKQETPQPKWPVELK